MSSNTFLAVYLGGGKNGSRMAAWNALPEAERRAKELAAHLDEMARGRRTAR